MPAIKGDMYINTHCNYSQPTLIKFDNENIGGHLTPLQIEITLHLSMFNLTCHLSVHFTNLSIPDWSLSLSTISLTCHVVVDIE